MTSAAERKRHIQRLALWLSLAIPLTAVIIYVLIWYGPDVLARHDVGNVTGSLRTLRLQQALDAARGRLLTLCAGLFAAGALLFTGRNYRVARQTLEVTEQGQVTDRYTKAIEQLGSDKRDVRIGGIYALERVAGDSVRDHPTVMEVLAAFIREHSHDPWPARQLNADGSYGTEDSGPILIQPDVQAAVIAIGRRNPVNDCESVDLRGADLSFANLGGMNFACADLAIANLAGASLTSANLKAANLGRATLTGSWLADTDLTGARLASANLTDAVLIEAMLIGAELFGADLSGANFDRADLTDALWPSNAAIPAGWSRDSHSGRLARASETPG